MVLKHAFVSAKSDVVDLEAQDTVQGLQYLESINILSAERAAEILG